MKDRNNSKSKMEKVDKKPTNIRSSTEKIRVKTEMKQEERIKHEALQAEEERVDFAIQKEEADGAPEDKGCQLI